MPRPYSERLEATCHTQHHKHNHRAQSWHVWNKTPTSSHPLHPLALSACDIDVCRLKSIQPLHPHAGMSSTFRCNLTIYFPDQCYTEATHSSSFCEPLGVTLREACTFASLLFGNWGGGDKRVGYFNWTKHSFPSKSATEQDKTLFKMFWPRGMNY